MSFRDTSFDGLRSVELRTPFARLVIVTEVGPRIAWFGKATGRNLLFWDFSKTLKREGWLLYGGHRIWHTRLDADESEETYVPDNDACEVKLTKAGIEVFAPISSAGIQKKLTVEVVSDQILRIENRIRNTSDMLWSGGIWSITATAPDNSSMYGIPLGDGLPWDVFTLVVPKKWGGTHTSRVNDPQITFTEDCLVVKPAGIESKRMIQAPQGVIGMTEEMEAVSFVKRCSFDPRLTYPLNTNIAFYIAPGNTMVEMEFMGPQQTLKPGEEMHLTEEWELCEPIQWA